MCEYDTVDIPEIVGDKAGERGKAKGWGREQVREQLRECVGVKEGEGCNRLGRKSPLWVRLVSVSGLRWRTLRDPVLVVLLQVSGKPCSRVLSPSLNCWASPEQVSPLIRCG